MTKRFFQISHGWLRPMVLATALSGLGSAQAQSHKDGYASAIGSVSIEAYGDVYAGTKPVSHQLSKVFFYRPAAALAPQPVNIYLDGRYHTSLLRGGFAETCMLPGAMAVQTVLDDASRQHTGKLDAGQRLQFDAGKTVYLRLQESAYAPPSLQLVSATAAQAELKNIRRQIHTVSRVKAVRECVDANEVAAAPQAPLAKPSSDQKFALQADALFEFGKAELRPAGYNAVQLLVQKVRSEYRSVDSIRVLGFTDAIGPKKLNRKLSEERAITVAEQIRASGINPVKGIQTEGRGPADLVKTSCANEPKPANKQCHAPSRGVDVDVFGVRN